MSPANALEAIAQIGVALAGFAGIVGALAGDRLDSRQPELWLPFWALISSGLGVVFAALFPFLLQQFDAPDNVVWATSSGFLFVVIGINSAYFLPRILRAARDGTFRRFPIVAVPLDSTIFVVLVTQVLNVLGIGFAQSAGGFLVGLYLMLLVSALNFAFLLFVLRHTPDASRSREEAVNGHGNH